MLQKILTILWITLYITSCSEESSAVEETEIPVVLSAEVEIYESNELEDGFVLAIENAGTEAYLINKEGFKTRSWEFDKNLGNDLELLPDGKLLGMFKVESPLFSFGGFGGIIRIMDSDGQVEWEYTYSTENYIAHHDVEMLPNGNVLFLAWERIQVLEAQAMGINAFFDTYTEVLIEIDPKTDEIIWEWHSKDHSIQDFDSNLPNYGVISQNPQLIDHNYNIQVEEYGGDIMHANGIDYDVDKDVIYISVNFYGEIWVIDHSTTIEDAASNSGGNYGKGGDLIYRFGNPEAYKSNFGSRLFNKVHFPNLLEGDKPGEGNMLVFVNGSNEQSTVYELRIPESFNLKTDASNELEIVWSFSDSELYAPIISGAVRLENGNTLICEGDYGYWEVTPNQDIVWKYNGSGDNNQKFWRGYSYSYDDPAIINLGL